MLNGCPGIGGLRGTPAIAVKTGRIYRGQRT
jgi:hypothetical protein